jgi:tRNA (guanine-N7-)-methyltransferase
MRLRHRKWADTVLLENKDIGINLSDIKEETVLPFDELEIGSGCGGFILELSKLHPEHKYLGVEINLNAFSMAVKKASLVKKEQTNFLLLNSPIDRVIPLIKDQQLNDIYINFPDPWPKKKQHHRRLSYVPMLQSYFRLLKDNGTIYFRTDNSDLFNDSVGYFKDSGLYDFEVISPFYSEKVDYLPATEYEKKFRAKGVAINLLIAHKKKDVKI